MVLGETSVFIDFDGIVATRPVEDALADHFGVARLETPTAAISIRERLAALLERLKDAGATMADLRQVAGAVDIDAAFDSLVDALHEQGADVVVLGDGLGFYLPDLLGRDDVTTYTNALGMPSFEMQWPNLDFGCACSTCGTCKQAPIRAARRAGRRAVFVGSRLVDHKAALLADHVFARGPLADYCEQWTIAHTWIADLDDLKRKLGL